MIGFLRFIGVINAAVWLGTVFFFTLFAAPYFTSDAFKAVIGETHFHYFSVVLAHPLAATYFHVSLVCAIIAWLHASTESLYFGRAGRKTTFTLLGILLGLVLITGGWLRPLMKDLHEARYKGSTQEEREKAYRSYRIAGRTTQVLRVCLLGGLVFYTWRVANPEDSARFISSVKFRG